MRCVDICRESNKLLYSSTDANTTSDQLFHDLKQINEQAEPDNILVMAMWGIYD